MIFFQYYRPKEIIILLNLFCYAKDTKSIKFIIKNIEKELKIKYDEYPIKNYYRNNECELNIYETTDNKFYKFHLCKNCYKILKIL